MSDQRDITRSTVVKQVTNFQNELMGDIFFKSVVRAISKVLCMEFSLITINTHRPKGDEKGPLFVHKQLFWWSA